MCVFGSYAVDVGVVVGRVGAEDGEGDADAAATPAQPARVLNQAEIDSLLGFDDGPSSGDARTGMQKIISSGLVSYERLPMLEIVFDRMIRLLSTSLRNLFQDNVEVTLDNITSVRFGDYLNAIPLPTLLGVFRAEQWENSGLVTVDSNLAYATFDLLLGGKRGGSSSRLDGRPFTAIESSGRPYFSQRRFEPRPRSRPKPSPLPASSAMRHSASALPQVSSTPPVCSLVMAPTW